MQKYQQIICPLHRPTNNLFVGLMLYDSIHIPLQITQQR